MDELDGSSHEICVTLPLFPERSVELEPVAFKTSVAAEPTAGDGFRRAFEALGRHLQVQVWVAYRVS